MHMDKPFPLLEKVVFQDLSAQAGKHQVIFLYLRQIDLIDIFRIQKDYLRICPAERIQERLLGVKKIFFFTRLK